MVSSIWNFAKVTTPLTEKLNGQIYSFPMTPVYSEYAHLHFEVALIIVIHFFVACAISSSTF